MRNILTSCYGKLRNISRPRTMLNESTRRKSAFQTSCKHCEKISVQVPSMGDSITEGTVVEWSAHIGQAVKVDDIIVLVETDKVTIDIKASVDGVITQHFCKVNDNVEVGSNLYEIDTEAEVIALNRMDEGMLSQDVTDSITSETTTPITNSVRTKISGVRTPSIQFLGRDGWKQKLNHIKAVALNPPNTKKNKSLTMDVSSLDPMFGRVPFSEREMDALMLGGASEAPYKIMD